MISSAVDCNSTNVHLHRLQSFIRLINEVRVVVITHICIIQTVGDAIADLLAVEAILLLNDMSIVDWDRCYEDAPSCQLKVNVS